MKPSKIYLLIISLACSLIAVAQRPTTLDTLLQGKTKLSDIIKTVDEYYKPRISVHNNTDDNFRRLKSWNRWGLYMSNRLNPNGSMADIARKNEEALQQMNSSLTSDFDFSYGNWSFIGPSSVNSSNISLGVGRCDRIAFHPSDSNIIYIGTPAGGLWKTINGGASWICLTNQLSNQSISGIVIDYTNPSIVYILTGDGDAVTYGAAIDLLGYVKKSSGVYKSIDGGINWFQTGPLANPPYAGVKLIQDPSNHNVLLAATSKGIYRTTNGGNSWQETYEYLSYDIEYAPNNPSIVYASHSDAVSYSTNGGIDWHETNFTDYHPDLGRIELAVSPANPSVVYALSGRSDYPHVYGGIFKSTDYGVSLTRQSNQPNILSLTLEGEGDYTQGGYDLAVVASPGNANLVITGAINLWSSNDGGTNMTNIMFNANNERKIHPDIHDMKYNPVNGALYVANDGGVYKSYDNGSSWSKISDGIATGMFYHLTGIEADDDILLGGLQDNGIKSRTTLTTAYNHNSTGDGFDVALRHNANTAGNDWGIVSINQSVYKVSLSGGASNEFIPYEEWFPTVAMNTNVSNIMYCGYSKIYKSSNGINWTQKSGSGSWALAICPSNTSRVFAAGGQNEYLDDDQNGILIRTDNGGDDWTTVFSQADTAYNKITDVAVNPTNSNQVWLTIGGYFSGTKVFKSIDGGESWTNVSGNLPDVIVNCIAVDASNNAYIGTDIGVFYKSNTQTNWLPFRNGMPVVVVTDLVINATAGLIRAATFGRGIYSSNLYSPCTPTLALNGTYGGHDFYEASSTISSAGNIFGGTDTRVFFKAGNEITFTPGFAATTGNEFKAYLGPCGDGIPQMLINQDSLHINTGAIKFNHEGGLEITNVTETSCNIKILPGKSTTLKLVLTDNDDKIIKEEPVARPAGKDIFNYTIQSAFVRGKMYKAILFADGTPIYWQEIIR